MSAEEYAHLSRPFDPAILRSAQRIAASYRLVLQPEPGLGYVGRTLEMPLVMSDGKSVEQCARSVLDATTLAVATILEKGERPPQPAAELRRDQQLNLRISAEERLRLESLSRRDGFRNISDYVRAVALRQSA